jgi:hypothetical protein
MPRFKAGPHKRQICTSVENGELKKWEGGYEVASLFRKKDLPHVCSNCGFCQ